MSLVKIPYHEFLFLASSEGFSLRFFCGILCLYVYASKKNNKKEHSFFRSSQNSIFPSSPALSVFFSPCLAFIRCGAYACFAFFSFYFDHHTPFSRRGYSGRIVSGYDSGYGTRFIFCPHLEPKPHPPILEELLDTHRTTESSNRVV